MKKELKLGPEFSFFKAPITQVTTPYKNINPIDVYRVLTGNYLKKQTLSLRSISDKNRNRNYKAAHFPFVTFSGTFNHRRESGLAQHSGLMVLDFDNVENLETLTLHLLNDKYFETQLLFNSPNGNGIKWIIQVYISENCSHGDYFDAVCNYIEQTYNIEVDRSGRDVARACFLSYDPNAFLNPRYGRMNRLFPGEIYMVKREKFNPSKWLKNKLEDLGYKPDPIINSMTKIQYHVEVVIRRIENQRIDVTVISHVYNDWLKLGFAFVDEFGEFGRTYYHRVSQFNLNYDAVGTDEQFDICLKNHRAGLTTIKTFFDLAKKAGVNVRV